MALETSTDIAIVGMACRYPGAPDLDAYWQLLRGGREGIRHFTEQELIDAGVPPETLADPQYVRSYGWLEGIADFDAEFFGYTPLEARLMDPQHRLFLEACWHALEHAGIRPDRVAGPTAVFGGTGQNAYRLRNLASRPDILAAAGATQATLANDPDFLSTRVSYKLGLTGPSMDVQTACSTSLVAAHLAVQSLLSGEADLALAGGASIVTTRKQGYRYVPEGPYSPDGHTRTFDARAQGMVGGDGVGVIVLKRLEDALVDGSCIYAVIKGTAVNNDGADRIGFTAPGTSGQARVIAEAQAVAGIEPESISYVELHGTATPLGDPIEFAALMKVFAGAGVPPGSIRMGSVKSNIGHTNAAAGAAGIIKVALALYHGELPASLHFENPNPEIPLDDSPFTVNTTLTPWKSPGRTAGVSSFGMGGTNAHAVLTEAPSDKSEPGTRPFELLTLSARSTSALERATDALAAALASAAMPLPDAAYTLHTGRQEMVVRRAVVAGTLAEAAGALQDRTPQQVFTAAVSVENPPCAFLLPGQGPQYPGMARGLYDSEPVFRRWLDRCAALFAPHLDTPLLEILFPEKAGDDRIHQTRYTQPAVFAVSYAAARLFMDWGVRPAALLGHSIGELTAACLSGVFMLEDGCRIVAARGALMDGCEPGAMLSVQLPGDELQERLPDGVEIAVINEPGSTVVSGQFGAIEAFEADLEARGVTSRRVRTSHAFHSAMMIPALAPFKEVLEQVTLSSPKIPFLSNVTGDWITPEQAVAPGYWARQVRSPVQFSSGIRQLLEIPNAFLLETGPGTILASLARRNGAPRAVSAGRHPQDSSEDAAVLATALGQLWTQGIPIDWHAYHGHEQRRLVSLPGYPFERQRHWVEPGSAVEKPDVKITRNPDPSHWFYMPSWQRSPLSPRRDSGPGLNWLLFHDPADSTAHEIADHLAAAGARVISASTDPQRHSASQDSDRFYPGAFRDQEDVAALVEFCRARRFRPDRIIHFSVGRDGDSSDLLPALLRVVQLADQAGWSGDIQITSVTRGGQEVLGYETPDPLQAAAAGFGRVVPQEFPGIRWRTIDLDAAGQPDEAGALLAEILSETAAPLDALRGRYRWTQGFEPVRLPQRHSIRRNGSYFITGGLGEIGRALAAVLLRDYDARVALVGRSASPEDPEVRALAALGGEVLVHAADVSNPEQLFEAVAAAEARFGPLHGVFHAAGRTGQADFRYLPETTPEDFHAHLEPKLGGAQALASALSGRSLDFCLLFSSVSSVLGGLGFAAYAAANAALDAFAAQMNRAGKTSWISLDSEGWAFGDAGANRLGVQLAGLAMQPDEGVDAVLRALAAHPGSQVILSTADLEARIARWQFDQHLESDQPEAAERPMLAVDFEAPVGKTEKVIQQIWEQLFGIRGIGVQDDFFQLGGHSLLATQVLNEIRKRYPHTRLSLGSLFDRPTIAGLAALVDASEHTDEPAALEATAADVDQMSDEEVEAMLRRLLDEQRRD